MFRGLLVTTLLYLMLHMSVCRSRGVIHGYCDYDDTSIWTRNYFTEEVLTKLELRWIYDIAVSKHTGDVYIASFIWPDNTLRVLKKDDSYRETKVVIDGVTRVNAVACDNYTPQVYVGTDKRLYIYNEKTAIVTDVAQIQYNVWRLFVPKNGSDVFVVTNGFDNVVYRYRQSFTDRIKLNITISYEAQHRFVVDGEGNYFYTTKEDEKFVTKIILKGDSTPTTYSHNGQPFSYLSVDNVGRVFGAVYQDRDLYRLKADGSKPVLVTRLDFDLGHSMCFDKNNDALFGTTNNEVVIFKFDYKCTFPPTTEITDTYITSDEMHESIQNMTIDLENMIERKSNETNSQIINMFNGINEMFTEIKISMKENVSNLSRKYDDITSNITNTASELKNLVYENNFKLNAMENRIDQINVTYSEIDNVLSGQQTDNKTEKLTNYGTVNFRPVYINSTIYQNH